MKRLIIDVDDTICRTKDGYYKNSLPNKELIEKLREYQSNGLYYFKSSKEFCSIVEKSIFNNDFNKCKLYIAPLYNQLINNLKNIKYHLVSADTVEICGTPDEYLLLQEKYKK